MKAWECDFACVTLYESHASSNNCQEDGNCILQYISIILFFFSLFEVCGWYKKRVVPCRMHVFAWLKLNENNHNKYSEFYAYHAHGHAHVGQINLA
jgi:hypothetical protein